MMKKIIFLILVLVVSAANLSADNIDIVIETTMGDINMELYPDLAPRTVANFVAYANDDYFDGLLFHRVMEGFMIQGGGYDPNNVKIPATYNAIKNESSNGLLNLRGTIAMARTAAADSATTEFFINHQDNPTLDLGDPNAVSEFGYAVFGSVDPNSMNIVDLIADVDVVANGSGELSDPVVDIIIIDVIVSDTSILDNVIFVDGEMVLLGDINDDFYVNFQDLAIMADDWLTETIVDRQWITPNAGSIPNAEYGGAIAMYENLAIIGAPGEDNGAGAAYIFEHDGTQWLQQAKLTSGTSGGNDDNFGFSVSIWNDHAVIGAPNSEATVLATTYTDAGAIYVFRKNDVDPNEPWSLLGRKNVQDGHDYAQFGYSVDIYGGLITVGAIGDNGSDTGTVSDYSGSVYVFNTTNGQKVHKVSGQPGDMMGHSVAIESRVIAAGSVYGKDPNTTNVNAGTIHVVKEEVFNNSSTWHTEKVLSASDGAENDWLGYSVDINNGAIMAGAAGFDGNNGTKSKSGAVYIFENVPISDTDPNLVWQQNKLTAPDAAINDFFGCAVALDDDFAIIGTKGDSDNGTNPGAAYLLKQYDSGWAHYEKLTDTTGQAGDYYGYAVALRGNKALVGAYGDDANEGSVEMIQCYSEADLNDDEIVNLLDFAIMAASWLGG